MPADPFSLDGLTRSWSRRAALVAARPFLSWLLRLRTYRRLYRAARALPPAPFEQRALAVLGITTTVEGDVTLGDVPEHGPLVIAANHPHGVLDGLVLLSVLRARRPDLRVLTNFLLARVPELSDLCFFVDPFRGSDTARRSHAGLRAAHMWVKGGGALLVFPSGEVAHRAAPGGGVRLDSKWHSTVGRIIASTGATALPVFLEGRNSRLFYAAGRVHALFRTALLARELVRRRTSPVVVRIGPAVPARTLSPERDAVATTEELRAAVDRLRSRSSPAGDLRAEVSRLPREARLADSGAFDVFLAHASEIPLVLKEIGRLREATYRAIGEGTGHSLDLDAFDASYLHLFSWHRERGDVVGAYRIGCTDTIMEHAGVAGLYTRSLFRYDERLVQRLSPALELGRSFVRVEYQRDYAALALLWKGIGRFVADHPRYRVLFGPVSISARYSDSSHQLLMAFLQQNCLEQDLAALVEAMHPAAVTSAPTDAVPASIEAVNRLIEHAEGDGKGVPVLLRQYLKLNAKLIGFSVDPGFGDALDALMMVDLTTVDRAILKRYLGRDGAERFLTTHRTHAA